MSGGELRRPSVGALAAVWLLVALALPAVVCAQRGSGDAESPEVRRPFRGLFGAPSLGSSQTLDFGASIFGSYDDDVFADQGPGFLASGVRQSGLFGGASASLSYAKKRPRYNLAGSLGGGATRYPEEGWSKSYRASAEAGAQLTRRTGFSVSDTFAYEPQFRLGFFVAPGDPSTIQDAFSPGAGDLGLFTEPSYRNNANFGLSHQLPDRTTATFYYSLLTASYQDSTFDYWSQSAGARYNRPVARNASLRLGYGYSVGHYSNATSFSGRRGVHNIDAGVDYSRALSVSRRTQFGFSTGSALYFVSVGEGQLANDRLRYAFLGNAHLTHEMGRTWTSSLAYRRSLDFHEGFADPFLTQAVTADLRGMLSRRLSFASGASYAAGVVEAGAASNLSSTSASSSLQYALSRSLAAYCSYVFYQYRLDNSTFVDGRLPRALSRNGVQVGLTTSIPLFRAK